MSETRTAPLPFAAPGPRRASQLRSDALAAAARHARATRLIAVGADQTIALDGRARLARLGPETAAPDADLTLLGVDDDGTTLFAYDATDALGAGRGREFAALREVALGLEASEAALAAQAVAMVNWHRTHRFCGRCGARTEVEQAGHARRCPGCGAHLFPRTDPAVIMLVVSGDRCVLSRRFGAPENRWSALAGFVEPGETPEAAVAREVREEVGLEVGPVRYKGAQPWPFPASLMLGFEAGLAPGAADGLAIEHAELLDARWFTRAALREALGDGQIDLPSELSLGHRLIQDWIDG